MKTNRAGSKEADAAESEVYMQAIEKAECLISIGNYTVREEL